MALNFETVMTNLYHWAVRKFYIEKFRKLAVSWLGENKIEVADRELKTLQDAISRNYPGGAKAFEEEVVIPSLSDDEFFESIPHFCKKGDDADLSCYSRTFVHSNTGNISRSSDFVADAAQMSFNKSSISLSGNSKSSNSNLS